MKKCCVVPHLINQEMELEYGEKVGSNIVQTKSLLENIKTEEFKKIAKFVKPMSPLTLLGNRGFPQKDFI